jgi:hypothetical protein
LINLFFGQYVSRRLLGIPSRFYSSIFQLSHSVLNFAR